MAPRKYASVVRQKGINARSRQYSRRKTKRKANWWMKNVHLPGQNARERQFQRIGAVQNRPWHGGTAQGAGRWVTGKGGGHFRTDQ